MNFYKKLLLIFIGIFLFNLNIVWGDTCLDKEYKDKDEVQRAIEYEKKIIANLEITIKDLEKIALEARDKSNQLKFLFTTKYSLLSYLLVPERDRGKYLTRSLNVKYASFLMPFYYLFKSDLVLEFNKALDVLLGPFGVGNNEEVMDSIAKRLTHIFNTETGDYMTLDSMKIFMNRHVHSMRELKCSYNDALLEVKEVENMIMERDFADTFLNNLKDKITIGGVTKKATLNLFTIYVVKTVIHQIKLLDLGFYLEDMN